MMKSYVKFLSRNKLYATIEALGLSVALAFVLILVSYATAEYRVGTNQKLAKELYVAGSGDYLGMTWGTAKEFFPSIPEIKGSPNLVHPLISGMEGKNSLAMPQVIPR